MEYIGNRKAGHDYSLEESIEAGIELFGYEVKSIRAKHGSLVGSYAIIRGGEAYSTERLHPSVPREKCT
jgi:SsrA-binding protein